MARVLLEQKLTLRVAGLEREIEIKAYDDGGVYIRGSLDVRVAWPTWPPRENPEPGDVWVHLNGMPSEIKIDVRREGNRNWWPGAGMWQYPGLDIVERDEKIRVTARGGILQEDVEMASVAV